MAEKIGQIDYFEPATGANTRAKYPWAVWTEKGTVWSIIRGVDFDVTVGAMAAILNTRAKRQGLGGVVVQRDYYNPDTTLVFTFFPADADRPTLKHHQLSIEPHFVSSEVAALSESDSITCQFEGCGKAQIRTEAYAHILECLDRGEGGWVAAHRNNRAVNPMMDWTITEGPE